jgi:hypothetical protein
MKEAETTHAPRAITSIWPAVVLLAFACVALAVALGYPAVAARFPVMVAGAMIVLTLLDIWSRTRLPGAGVVKAFGGTGFERREMRHNPSFAHQAECAGWIAGAFGLMATVGILAASPIFAAAFVRFRGKRSLTVVGVVGLGILVFQFVVFEWALDYELYRGLFFTRGGVSAW